MIINDLKIYLQLIYFNALENVMKNNPRLTIEKSWSQNVLEDFQHI